MDEKKDILTEEFQNIISELKEEKENYKSLINDLKLLKEELLKKEV